MNRFEGRSRELDRLRRDLDDVRATGRGKMLAVRGRRQVGKSRLLTEFVEQSEVPYVYTTAVKGGPPVLQVELAMSDLAISRRPLPEHPSAYAAPATTWADLFARLPLAIDRDPAIIVLDEFPWAVETDETLEGVLQRAWDRWIEPLPVLFVLVGSDLAMMERLTEHDRPLYGRAEERVVTPLSPADVAHVCGTERDPLDVLDAYLITGGYPRLVFEAARKPTARSYARAQLQDDASPLLVVGQRVLSAELRDAEAARTVLEAIGAVEVGHATFSSAVSHLGADESAPTRVTRALEPLRRKGLVAVEVPVGATPKSRLRRYRICDPYLRFWFRFGAPELSNIERGRADLAVARFDRGFEPWRGRAIEPVVHDAVGRLAAGGNGDLGGVEQVGSWWDRTSGHEYDVVAADRRGDISWIGTVKWRPRRPVSARELSELVTARSVVPRAEAARLLAVCPAGVAPDVRADAVLDARAVLDAFA